MFQIFKNTMYATIALAGVALSGCAETQASNQPCPNVPGYNGCALRDIIMNPYADPETRRYAELILADSRATTPSQHALVNSLAQQPQTVVVPVVPAW